MGAEPFLCVLAVFSACGGFLCFHTLRKYFASISGCSSYGRLSSARSSWSGPKSPRSAAWYTGTIIHSLATYFGERPLCEVGLWWGCGMNEKWYVRCVVVRERSHTMGKVVVQKKSKTHMIFLTYGRNGVATYGEKGCWDFLVTGSSHSHRSHSPPRWRLPS